MDILERYAVRTMSFIMGTVFGVLAILIVLAMLADLADAATYNTFFNNVEQGPNGQANPSLMVNGKGFSATKRPADNPTEENDGEEGSGELTVQTNQPPSNTGGSVVANAPEVKTEASPDHALFPVRVTASVLSRKSTFTSQELKTGPFNYTFKGKESSNGGLLGLTLYPLRDFAIHGFAGASSGRKPFFGGEVQFVPIRFGLFGLQNLLEAGMLVGASTLGRGDWSRSSGKVMKGTIHSGIHAGINFGPRYGVVTALRTNLTDRSTMKFWLADVGMSVRF